jgi:hypothetical protein
MYSLLLLIVIHGEIRYVIHYVFGTGFSFEKDASINSFDDFDSKKIVIFKWEMQYVFIRLANTSKINKNDKLIINYNFIKIQIS